MKQVVYNDRGEVYLKEVDPPVMKGPGAIVKTAAIWVVDQGRSRRLKEYRRNPGDGKYEKGMSYQSSGFIEEKTADVNYDVGDLVACSGMGYAWWAEKTWCPKFLMAEVPPEVSPEEAASTNLGCTALYGFRRAGLSLGETVVVIGLGGIGQIAVQMARAAGCKVIGTDIIDGRVKKARELGTKYALNPRREDVVSAVLDLTEGLGADVVMVCCHAPQSVEPLQQAHAMVRNWGKIIVIGATAWEGWRQKDRGPMARSKTMDVHLIRGRGPGYHDPGYEMRGVDYPQDFVRWSEQRNIKAYLDMIAEKKINVKALISRRFILERVSEIFDPFIENPGETIGVILEWRE